MEATTAAALLCCFLSVSGTNTSQSTFAALGGGGSVVGPCTSVSNMTPCLGPWVTWSSDGTDATDPPATPTALFPGRCDVLSNGSIAIDDVVVGDEVYVCHTPSSNGSAQTQVVITMQDALDPDLSTPPGVPLTGQCRLLNPGRLSISGMLLSKAGRYVCDTTSPDHVQIGVQLRAVDGPESVSTSVGGAAAVLPNGTAVTYRGSSVSFNCSSSARPSQSLSWGFRGLDSGNDSLATGGGSSLAFRIDNIQPSAQGEYWCTSQNSLTHKTANRSAQLLVYYAPERHPECMWSPGEDPSHVLFWCLWPGAYPPPRLRWGENHHGAGHLYASRQADSLAVKMNRSELFDGLALKCTAHHPAAAAAAGEEKNCVFTLKPPYPEGEPKVTAVRNSNVTLVCTESDSLPPANTTWRKGAEREDLVPGSRYLVSLNGPQLSLTIVNVSAGDEGVYYCRSENPLGVRELEVILTVAPHSGYTGLIIGIFIALLIVGSGSIVAYIMYNARDRTCLGHGFTRMDDAPGDVLNLVESDEEATPPRDAVPRLPALSNGHRTTLVQIHHIPSGDHEDIEIRDTSPQRPEDVKEAESAVDLVTF